MGENEWYVEGGVVLGIRCVYILVVRAPASHRPPVVPAAGLDDGLKRNELTWRKAWHETMLCLETMHVGQDHAIGRVPHFIDSGVGQVVCGAVCLFHREYRCHYLRKNSG